jgi:peptidoglycan/xylan/chitin deacetylase (PgdA/CDA1 family)
MIAHLQNDVYLSPRQQRWMPVLMYHRVVDHEVTLDPYHLCISTDDFAAQMAYLSARGYQAIPLDEVPRVLAGTAPWRKPVAITFDDGYRDTLTHAFPLLEKHGLMATIMLVSDCIGGYNAWDCEKTDAAPLLSVEELRKLAQRGVRFGAHGATHAALPELALDAVHDELLGCKRKLEQLLDCPISTLAYPYGRSTARVREVAEELGFIAAFGVDHGSRALFNYSRIDAAAYRGDSLVWRMKVRGIYDSLRQSRGLRSLNSLRRRMCHGATS